MKKIINKISGPIIIVPSIHGFPTPTPKFSGMSNPAIKGVDYIWFANCKTTEEIPALIKSELKIMKDLLRQTKHVESIAIYKSQIKNFESIQKNISNKTNTKEIPEPITEFLKQRDMIRNNESGLMFSKID